MGVLDTTNTQRLTVIVNSPAASAASRSATQALMTSSNAQARPAIGHRMTPWIERIGIPEECLARDEGSSAAVDQPNFIMGRPLLSAKHARFTAASVSPTLN
jgi:hypothetical protein